MFEIAPHPRYRRSPYFAATVAAGVTSFTPYNQMLLPTGYGDPEAEYWRLIQGVSQWDVAGQRQVQITGPDAAKLAQILTPRNLDNMKLGQGKYVPLVDYTGTLINDPVLLKLDEQKFWFSIADSNIWFWARAIAAERKLDVSIIEPDVSPMAIQGPKAGDVVASIFGDWVHDLKHFWFREATVDGIPMVVARSGWSKQGGFELYLMDRTKGTALWNLVAEAGSPWEIGPGSPNPNERIESGLLSWGGDTDAETNPFEVGLDRYVDLDVSDDVVGIQALRRIHAEGPRRHQLGLILDGDTPGDVHSEWFDIVVNGEKVGDMTNGVWSRRLAHNIGYALIDRTHQSGDTVGIVKNDETTPAKLVDLPFIAPPKQRPAIKPATALAAAAS